MIAAPKTVDELLSRAEQICGLSFAQLAGHLEIPLPLDPVNAKGWMGQLIENALGATSGSRPVPDFEALGIELKTLPLIQDLPKESTFVCSTPIPNVDKSWRESRVYDKLKKVLWVFIEYDKYKPISHRRIGKSILWTMDSQTEAILKQDWEELTEKLALGKFDELSAHHGQYLQIRPKASSSQVFIDVLDSEGQRVKIVPKGFYLRTSFTKEIILGSLNK
jgi:DNA mismatch repair protein MutH